MLQVYTKALAQDDTKNCTQRSLRRSGRAYEQEDRKRRQRIEGEATERK